MSRGWTAVRVLLCSLLVIAGLTVVGTGSALAATGDCGVPQAGETPESSFAALKSALANATSGQVFYLTATESDPTNSGGLSSSQSATIDLDGCTLSVTHPGAGTPAVSGIGIEDNTANQDGVLIATGGAGTSSLGGAPGIAGGVNLSSGTVKATGGAGTDTTGAGAGVGGYGGVANEPGTSSTFFDVTGGTLTATGGASGGSGTNDAGAGAGIGGGGGGAGQGGGSQGSDINLNGGTITAVGGAATSTNSTVNGGAGAGIGGGGGGNGAAGGSVNQLSGGTDGGDPTVNLVLTPGQITGTAGTGNAAAGGFGPGGGQATPNASSADDLDLEYGTYAISGEITNGIYDSNAALAVPAGKSLTLDAPPGYTLTSSIDDTLSLPASSTLNVNDQTLNLAGTGDTLDGTVNVSSAAELAVTGSGGLTLGKSTTVAGSIYVIGSAQLTIPSGVTLTLDGGNSTNSGTTDVAGTLTGSSSLNNDGSIVLSGSGAIPGHGEGQNGQLSITGHNYEITYSTPPSLTAPPTQWVYAPNFADGGETVAALPSASGAVTGEWVAGGTLIDDDTYLPNIADANGVVAVTADYTFNTTLSETPTNLSPTVGDWVADAVTVDGSGTYGSPTGDVTFYVCGPLISADGCTASDGTQLNTSLLTAGSDDTSSTYSTGVHVTAPGEYCFAATYGGDTEYLPSNGSGSSCFTVAGTSASTPATSDGTNVTAPTIDTTAPMAGQPAKLSTTVSDATGAPSPGAGQVTFFVNGTTTLCVAQVSSGRASCETSSLPAGADTITAVYEGSAGYAVSATSPALSVQVQPSNQVAVQAISSVRQASRVAVRLKLPNSGTVHFTVAVGKVRFAAASAKVIKARSAKAVTKSFTLKLKPATKAFLAAHHGAVKVRVTITYTPVGGKARTVIKTVSLTATRL